MGCLKWEVSTEETCKINNFYKGKLSVKGQLFCF